VYGPLFLRGEFELIRKIKMKKLYLLVSNGGDGSYSINYTFNKEWIDEQQRRYDNDESDFEYDPGIDGDGFHYDVINVPEDCTLESLGIHYDCAKE
jgi:6-phosphofructokinase